MLRSFSHADFPLELLLERKRRSLSVVLPAREVADTVGQVVERILGLEGLVDQVLVVDAASEDGSAEVARAAGAETCQQADLRPELGEVLGKGDAMWRALTVVRGELVAYVDSDTRDFPPHFVTGLFGPLICERDVQFVKASYRRPFSSGGVDLPDGGGRVSQLMARPLLSAFYPALAELKMPLTGEVAATRELLERIPFHTGYAVETAMLLDVLEAVGPEAIAQVDLGEHRNAHQTLAALRPMAEEVLAVVSERLRREGRLRSESPVTTSVERPPSGRTNV